MQLVLDEKFNNGSLGTACAKKDLRAPPRGYINSLVGEICGFGLCRSTIFPHQSRTGDPNIIKSPRNSRQGAGSIWSKISASITNKNKFNIELSWKKNVKEMVFRISIPVFYS